MQGKDNIQGEAPRPIIIVLDPSGHGMRSEYAPITPIAQLGQFAEAAQILTDAAHLAIAAFSESQVPSDEDGDSQYMP